MYVLAIVAVAVVIVAILEIGPPTSSARTSKEVVTAENGVVQSTVTGTGNVEAGTDVDVNFKTSGTLQHVYVSEGQHVIKGQLLATLDPTSAQLGVDQAESQLTAAQYQLTAAENGTSSGSGGSGGSAGSSTTASLEDVSSSPEFVSYTPPSGKNPEGSHRGEVQEAELGREGEERVVQRVVERLIQRVVERLVQRILRLVIAKRLVSQRRLGHDHKHRRRRRHRRRASPRRRRRCSARRRA